MEEESGQRNFMSKNEELFNIQKEEVKKGKKSRKPRRLMLIAFIHKPPIYYNMYNKGRG